VDTNTLSAAEPQAYVLTTADGVWRVTATDPAGAFYAIQTCLQLLCVCTKYRKPSRTGCGDPFAATSPLSFTSRRDGDSPLDVDTVKMAGKAPVANVPFVQITDWPTFTVRGVMYDVTRTRVPHMSELLLLVDLLAGLKLNHLQLCVCTLARARRQGHAGRGMLAKGGGGRLGVPYRWKGYVVL